MRRTGVIGLFVAQLLVRALLVSRYGTVLRMRTVLRVPTGRVTRLRHLPAPGVRVPVSGPAGRDLYAPVPA
ncbi:hypothetical protein, partial [Streptomyces sp. SID6137]|uniref:hypothetical protein n=2 Tax=unclassified Streptomyces TaxID=2593676 RepID=UPI001F292DAB